MKSLATTPMSSWVMVVCKKVSPRRHVLLQGKTISTIIIMLFCDVFLSFPSVELNFGTSHLQLGKLIVLYDDNKITIDGDTAFSFTEDVNKRFEAYGWHVQTVGDGDENTSAIKQAVEAAQKVTDKPSLIKVRTTIGKVLATSALAA